MVMKVNMNWMAFFQANLDGDNSAKGNVWDRRTGRTLGRSLAHADATQHKGPHTVVFSLSSSRAGHTRAKQSSPSYVSAHLLAHLIFFLLPIPFSFSLYLSRSHACWRPALRLSPSNPAGG